MFDFLARKISTNSFLSLSLSLIIESTHASRCQSAKSRNGFFPASVHLTLSRYYYFISFSSFYLPSSFVFFFSLFASLVPSRVWWLALLDKPLSPTRPRRPTRPTHTPHTQRVSSYPLLPTHPSPCLTPPPLDSASPRRHATFDFHEKDDDEAAASRKVPVEESPLLLCPAGSVFVHSTIVEVYCRP